MEMFSPGLMDEDHFEVVGKGGQHSSMSFEVDVSDGNGTVTKKAKLSLHVELLQQEEAVRRHLHDPSETQTYTNPAQSWNHPAKPGTAILQIVVLVMLPHESLNISVPWHFVFENKKPKLPGVSVMRCSSSTCTPGNCLSLGCLHPLTSQNTFQVFHLRPELRCEKQNSEYLLECDL